MRGGVKPFQANISDGMITQVGVFTINGTSESDWIMYGLYCDYLICITGVMNNPNTNDTQSSIMPMAGGSMWHLCDITMPTSVKYMSSRSASYGYSLSCSVGSYNISIYYASDWPPTEGSVNSRDICFIPVDPE